MSHETGMYLAFEIDLKPFMMPKVYFTNLSTYLGLLYSHSSHKQDSGWSTARQMVKNKYNNFKNN